MCAALIVDRMALAARTGRARAQTGSQRSHDGLAALTPAYAPVDGRDLAQLMCFVADFSRQLSFIALDGSRQGNWQGFFDDDLSFLLARILCFDPRQQWLRVERIVHGESQPEQRNTRLLAELFALFEQVSQWALKAKDISACASLGTPTSLSLENLIRQQLSPLYQSLNTSPDTARRWQAWQQAYLARQQLNPVDQSWLLGLWQSSTGQPDPQESPDLHTVAQSFIERIQHSMPPMRAYFSDSLNTTFGHQPHTALITAFLLLLRHAQADANAVTGRHLEFYYRTVLRLQQRAPTPDHALLSLQPSPGSQGSLAPAGSLIKAGKLPNGQDLHYTLDYDLVVNQDQIGALKTVCAAPSEPLWPTGPAGVRRLYASPQADSADGLGAPLSAPDAGWPTFGQDWGQTPAASSSAPLASIGLLLTSPLLLLRGGRRTLRLRLQYQQQPSPLPRSPLSSPASDGATAMSASFDQVASAYRHAVIDTLSDGTALSPAQLNARVASAINASCDIWLTTAAGWQQVSQISVCGNRQQGWLELILLLPASFPAIEAGPACPQEAGGQSPWPRLKLLLRPDAPVYPYAYLQQLNLSQITLRTTVVGLTPAQLANSQGPLNPAQPFFPLGNAPVVGSYLQLSDPELASKPIQWATVRLDWFNLPLAPLDLTQHYAGYGPPTVYNSSFQVGFTLTQGGRRSQLGAPQPLCAANTSPDAPQHTSVSFTLRQSGQAAQPWEQLSMQLLAPAGGFGHAQYPQLLTNASLQAAAALTHNAMVNLQAPASAPAPDSATTSSASLAAAPLPPPPQPVAPSVCWPNPPLSPQASRLSLDYQASEQVYGSRAMDELGTLMPCFFHLGPFGYCPAPAHGNTLLDGLQRPGQLYIGLNGLQPGQIISLLFGMHETDAQQQAARQGWPHSAGAPASPGAVDWYYLLDNQWQRFAASERLSDSTDGLTGSGVLRLQTQPRRLNQDNTLMPPGLFWLAAVTDQPAAHSHTTLLDTQGALATQVLTGLDPMAAGPQPANSLQGFVSKPAGIQGLRQALPTAGGVPAETAQAFRVRVSQRLRHKQRVVRALDIEQLTLDAFPSVSQAKCITPATLRQRAYPSAPLAPGALGVVVVPQPAADHTFSAQPCVPVPTLLAIRQLLLAHSSASVPDIRVFSPEYEEIKVCVQIELVPDSDFAYYRHQLNRQISDWLAPWRSDSSQALPIGGGNSNMNDLYVYLANQPYVRKVGTLYALHVFSQGAQRHTRWLVRDDELIPSTPWSVLAPARQHFISPPPQCYGIGQMVVGEDVMSFENAPAPALVLASPPSPDYSLNLPVSALPDTAHERKRHGQKT